MNGIKIENYPIIIQNYILFAKCCHPCLLICKTRLIDLFWQIQEWFKKRNKDIQQNNYMSCLPIDQSIFVLFHTKWTMSFPVYLDYNLII